MLLDVHLGIVISVAKSPSNVKFYLLLKCDQYLSKPKYALWESKDSKHTSVGIYLTLCPHPRAESKEHPVHVFSLGPNKPSESFPSTVCQVATTKRPHTKILNQTSLFYT